MRILDVWAWGTSFCNFCLKQSHENVVQALTVGVVKKFIADMIIVKFQPRPTLICMYMGGSIHFDSIVKKWLTPKVLNLDCDEFAVVASSWF